MPVESISCPNCGVPLRQASFDDPWLCLYCNSLIRVEGDAEAPKTSLQHGLKADEMGGGSTNARLRATPGSPSIASRSYRVSRLSR